MDNDYLILILLRRFPEPDDDELSCLPVLHRPGG